MKTKTFDCVAMKRRGALSIHQDTKDLSVGEKVEYWRRQGEKLNERLERLAAHGGERSRRRKK